MTTSTVTARRKGDPQHSVEGNKSKNNLKKGFVAKTTAAFSFLEGGPTKRKSINDDKHGQGQEKRRPTTFS